MEQISREDKKEPNTCKAIRNGKRERIEKENERGIKISYKENSEIKNLNTLDKYKIYHGLIFIFIFDLISSIIIIFFNVA